MAIRQHSMVVQLAVIAGLAVVAGGGWLLQSRWPRAASPAKAGSVAAVPAVPVEVRAARLGRVASVLEAVGSTLANESVSLSPKVSGIVERLAFTDGQRVKAGDVLVELAAGDLKAELAAKRAMRDNARQVYDRARKLLATHNMPEAKVEEASALLLQAEARIRADEAKLAEHVIRAPFSGRLGLRKISLGALVTPATEIVTLDDASVVKLDFEAPETVLAALKPGLALSARSAAFPGQSFAGQVTVVGSRVDPASRSLPVRAELGNERDLLKPGMFMEVTLTLGERDGAVLIPEQAVWSQDDRKLVYQVLDGRAVETQITLGRRVGAEVEAAQGLKAGDVVVVSGLQKVRDGSPVRVLNGAGS